jgi:hypothetical protein
MSLLTFAQVLTQAETQARSTLAPELHERLSAAVTLVTDGRAFQTSAGHWTVDSATSLGKVYTVHGSCDCDDIHFNKPPQDLCKHRLAMFLARKVQADVGQAAQGATEVPWDAKTPAPARTSVPPASGTPLPEAPASVNVHVTIAGRDVLVTLRDTDEARLLVRLEELLQRYPLPPPAPEPPARQGGPQGPGKGWCSKHGCAMKLNHGKDGRSWYSHKVDGRWCKGR